MKASPTSLFLLLIDSHHKRKTCSAGEALMFPLNCTVPRIPVIILNPCSRPMIGRRDLEGRKGKRERGKNLLLSTMPGCNSGAISSINLFSKTSLSSTRYYPYNHQPASIHCYICCGTRTSTHSHAWPLNG